MSRSTMTRVKPIGVSGEQVLHPLRKIGLRSTKKNERDWACRQVGDLKAELADGCLEPFQEPAVIRLVAEDLLPRVAAGHRVVDRSGQLNAEEMVKWLESIDAATLRKWMLRFKKKHPTLQMLTKPLRRKGLLS